MRELYETKPEPPFALCHCGTPLVSTFEVSKKEWYCVKCQAFFEWLHAQRGSGPNPTPELADRYDAAKEQYNAERERRIVNSLINSDKEENKS